MAITHDEQSFFYTNNCLDSKI